MGVTKMPFLREEEKSLLKAEDSLRSLENSFENHEHDVVEMLLSAVDDEPHEDTYEDLDDIESLSRRYSLRERLQKSWKFGVFLAMTSGVLFTGNNCLIQYFKVDPLELLLVRSTFQAIILGSLTKILPPTRTYPIPQSTNIRVKFWIALQAVLGALRLYLSFSCLQYLPLGDALTIIFTEPLFTVVLSFILIKASIGFTKIILCIGLLTGMTLSIQPPFLFGPKSNNNTSDLIQDNKNYYVGVTLALSCAIFGSLCNILINKCDQIKSSLLVFYAGVSGIIISILVCLANSKENFYHLGELKATDWLILTFLSLSGILGYFTMTISLKMVSPTSVSVLRALEIILAYICQAIILHIMPNTLCIIGSILVILCVTGIAIVEKSRKSSQETSARTLQIARTFIVNPSAE